MTHSAGPGGADNGALVAVVEGLVDKARFTPVRGRRGYDTSQVDDFLDSLIGLVRNAHPIDVPVDLVAFRPTRVREGYDAAEVDAFLDHVVASVARAHRGEVPVEQVDGESEPAPTVPAPSVIVEQRGFISRLFRSDI